MSGTTALAKVLAPLVGTGPGAGMGLMSVLFGVLGAVASIAGFAYRPLRQIEDILPDYDMEDDTSASPDAS